MYINPARLLPLGVAALTATGFLEISERIPRPPPTARAHGAHRSLAAAAMTQTQTQDLEMAGTAGAYYPPPRAGAGGEDLDDDGRKKRTGKPTSISVSLSLSDLLCLVVGNERANGKNLGRPGRTTARC